MKRKTLKPADALLWLILLAATAITITGFNGGRSGTFANIITPAGVKTVGLEVDQTFTVDGKNGDISYYEHLKSCKPDLTKTEYMLQHRVIIEYLGKIAKNKVREQIKDIL